jgi:hypothetical protein
MGRWIDTLKKLPESKSFWALYMVGFGICLSLALISDIIPEESRDEWGRTSCAYPIFQVALVLIASVHFLAAVVFLVAFIVDKIENIP